MTAAGMEDRARAFADLMVKNGVPFTPPEISGLVAPVKDMTGAMITAGSRYIVEEIGDPEKMGPGFSADRMAISVYRAMHAVAPVDFVREGERQAVKERDEARCELHEQSCRIGAISRAYFELLCAIDPSGALCPTFEADGTNVIWKDRDAILALIRAKHACGREQLAARDARIAELKSILAEKARGVPLGIRPHASDCAVHNEPASSAGPCDCGAMNKPSNPFRDFGGDRRRIGG